MTEEVTGKAHLDGVSLREFNEKGLGVVIFVIDNSLSMSWCRAGETTAYPETMLERLQTEEAWVPAIWPFEMINVELVSERKNQLSRVQPDAFLEVQGDLPISVQEIVWPGKAWALLMRGWSGLSVCDTAYLDLALRNGCSLPAQDQKMQEAAKYLEVMVV